MASAEVKMGYGDAGVQDFGNAHGVGAITDDTQMSLFTAEGLIRAQNRWLERGICHTPTVVHHAYLRWLITQGETLPLAADEALVRSGWLVMAPELQHRRAPGNTCLSALRAPAVIGHRTNNQSKGCGGVMRVAPVGLVGATDPFDLGCDLAALTHGHPTGYLAAGGLALLIAHLISGDSLTTALRTTIRRLERDKHGDETATALTAAIAAGEEPPSQKRLEALGAGWTAEEALAIAVYASLQGLKGKRDTPFLEGVSLAVAHGGDSDSTGAIAGNILGAALGVDAIPERLLNHLEARAVITEVADDFVRHFVDPPPAPRRPADWPVMQSWPPARDWDKYPGY